MISQRFARVGLVLALALIFPACGGGGGGGGTTNPITVTSVEVTTQTVGPLSPFGTTQGGDEVRIEGSGFANGLTVRFGTARATVLQVTGTFVRVTAPNGPEGLVTISITNPNSRRFDFPDAYRYVAPPTITRVEVTTGPTTGENRVPIAGGETAVVHGANCKAGLRFFFDDRLLTPTSVEDDKVTFTVPASPIERPVDLRIENPEGLSATLSRGLSYTQEFSLAQERGALTPVRARHLFRRAAFGATPARIDQAELDGIETTVDKLMTYSNDDAVEATALTLWGRNGVPTTATNFRVPRQWWTYLMLKNSNPFQERLAWFLHDHFATSNATFPGDAQWYFYHQIHLFRRFSMATTDNTDDGGAGLNYNWKQLLIDVCKDRAMLEWLDGRRSIKGNPNENFARELWELFSLGEGNGYTEDDIKEAAKAFTGFQWYRSQIDPTNDTRLRIRYIPLFHDEGDKTIFGVTGKFGYDDVAPFYFNIDSTQTDFGTYDTSIATDSRDTDGGIVALTLRERDVLASQFICRKLCAFFLYDNPPDIVVNELAEDLRASGPDQWNLKPVIRKMLLSKAMYSSRAIKGQVRNPVEFILEFMRTTEVDLAATASQNTFRVLLEMGAMGQEVLNPPDVNGWPTGNAWLSSQGMLSRTNFVNTVVEGLDDFDTQIAPLVPAAGQRSASQLVDHIARVLDVQLSGSARTHLIGYVVTQEQNGATVPFAYDQNNEEHVKMKARGLLYLIAHYHDANKN